MLQKAGLTYYGVGKSKFAKMLAVGLLLVALSYGMELLLAVAVATSMNVCVFLLYNYYCCDVLVH